MKSLYIRYATSLEEITLEGSTNMRKRKEKSEIKKEMQGNIKEQNSSLGRRWGKFLLLISSYN